MNRSRGWARLLCVMVAIVSVMTMEGCQKKGQTAPEEYLNRAISGLSGTDYFTFQGQTAIRGDVSGIYEHSAAFEGELKNHQLLTLTARPVKTAAGEQGGSRAVVKYERGQWKAAAEGYGSIDWTEPLNPLLQLEEIGKSDKTVTEELGASRGTRMLRIKLSSEAARQMTEKTLKAQMERLRHRITDRKDSLYAPDPAVRSRLLAVWKQENGRLETMLKDSEASAVYHLTVSKKTGLPQKLTLERVVEYNSPAGKMRSETLLSEVRFEGFK